MHRHAVYVCHEHAYGDGADHSSRLAMPCTQIITSGFNTSTTWVAADSLYSWDFCYRKVGIIAVALA